MNVRALFSAAPGSQSVSSSPPAESSTMMSCEVCELVGGPFSAAEAAHLRAIHDRLHHGITVAA